MDSVVGTDGNTQPPACETAAAPLGSLKHDRDSIRGFLCGSREKCRLFQYLPLAAPVGAVRAVVTLVIGGGDGDAIWELIAEHWLVRASAGERLTRRLLATSVGPRLNYDPPGAPAGMLSLNGQQVHYDVRHQSAGSVRWMAGYNAVFGLDPPMVLSESGTSGDFFEGCNFESWTWLWRSFSGTTNWSRRAHARDKAIHWKRRPMTDPISGRDMHRCVDFAYDYIPDVVLDDGFKRDGWRSAALGSCALNVDGTQGRGFVVGATGPVHSNASFRAVLSGRDLFLEVVDDHFVGSSSVWANDDHVEIWLSDEADGWGADVNDVQFQDDAGYQSPEANEWLVRPSDGSVLPAFGSPTARLRVERFAVDEHTVRLRARLPEFKGITIAYNDSDGHGSAVVLATSHLVPGAGSTLGQARRIDPARATCSVIAGKLDAVVKTVESSECPLLPQW
jgi:hypothetical protein